MPAAWTVTPAEKRWVAMASGFRADQHSDHGLRPTGGVLTDTLCHTVGMLGEYAVARFLGLDPTRVFRVYDGGSDQGVDLVYRGMSISVKTRHTWNNPDVLIDHQDGDQEGKIQGMGADLLVACSLSCSRKQCHCIDSMLSDEPIPVHILGWTTLESYQAQARVKNLGKGLRWLFPVDRLHGMHNLFLL